MESGFFVFCVMRNFLFFLILLFNFTPCSVATERIQIKSNFSCLKIILWRPSSRLSKVLWRKNEKARKKLELIVTMISRIIRLTQLFTGPHEVFLWEKKLVPNFSHALSQCLKKNVMKAYRLRLCNAFKSSHSRCSFKKAVLNNFAIFTRKHLCWSLFLIKLLAFSSATLLKRGSSTDIFLRMSQKF